MKRQPNIIRFLLRTLVCVVLTCGGAGAQAGSIDPSTGQIIDLPPAHISEVTLESTAEGKIIANHNGKRYDLVELADATAGRLAARLAEFYELSERLSLLPDNDKEFAANQIIAKALDIDFYFARPYHSWERGANQNTNGLIRQYIPIGNSLQSTDQQYITNIETMLNNRPEKKVLSGTFRNILSIFV